MDGDDPQAENSVLWSVVPELVGLTVTAAREACIPGALVPQSGNPDGIPLGALAWPGVFVVTSQSPDPQTIVRRGDTVLIEFEPERGTPPATARRKITPPPDGLAELASRENIAPPAPSPAEDAALSVQAVRRLRAQR